MSVREPVMLSSDDETPYEAESARRLETRHAVSFGFARHALSAVLLAAGTQPGDEVLLSPLTCKVVPLSLLWIGVKPVYVDISPVTLNLDAEQLESKFTAKTRAVVFQHTYGSDAGLSAVADVTRLNRRLLIEDCAQCMPIRWPGYAPGSVGDAAVFSNNLLKPLPAGSGGLATTNDDELVIGIRKMRRRMQTPGWREDLRLRAETMIHQHLLGPRTYWTALELFKRIGANYREKPIATEIHEQVEALAFRPSHLQSQMGMAWLRRIDAVAEHRRLSCAEYEKAFEQTRSSAVIARFPRNSPLLYCPALTDRKAEVLAEAKRRRLPIVAWPGSTPMYPVERLETLRTYGYEPGSSPAAEHVARRLFGLPTDLTITTAHRQHIVDLVTSTSPA